MNDTFPVTFYIDRTQPDGQKVYTMIIGDVELERVVVQATSTEDAAAKLAAVLAPEN
jgi:hypothetical protein